jgi:hypothetical protein
MSFSRAHNGHAASLEVLLASSAMPLPELTRVVGYTQLVERSGSVLQMNEDIDVSAPCLRFVDAHEHSRRRRLHSTSF